MTASAVTSNNVYTLAERLTGTEIPVGEALKYASAIAESLRDLHDSGKIHGWLSPSAVAITETGIELVDVSAPSEDAKGYTAPEVLAGEPADVRSDIFSLGALLAAMIDKSPAFEAGASLAVVKPAQYRSAIERFLSFSMAHDPASRPQKMNKVLMELKFLAINVRRAEAGSFIANVREVMRGVETVNRRLIDAEHEIEELRNYSAMLEERVATGLQCHEQTLHAHSAAIDSAQVSAEQTDNLVERLIDALDLVQSTLIEQTAAPAPTAG